jgi:hypothetical protein
MSITPHSIHYIHTQPRMSVLQPSGTTEDGAPIFDLIDSDKDDDDNADLATKRAESPVLLPSIDTKSKSLSKLGKKLKKLYQETHSDWTNIPGQLSTTVQNLEKHLTRPGGEQELEDDYENVESDDEEADQLTKKDEMDEMDYLPGDEADQDAEDEQLDAVMDSNDDKSESDYDSDEDIATTADKTTLNEKDDEPTAAKSASVHTQAIKERQKYNRDHLQLPGFLFTQEGESWARDPEEITKICRHAQWTTGSFRTEADDNTIRLLAAHDWLQSLQDQFYTSIKTSAKSELRKFEVWLASQAIENTLNKNGDLTVGGILDKFSSRRQQSESWCNEVWDMLLGGDNNVKKIADASKATGSGYEKPISSGTADLVLQKMQLVRQYFPKVYVRSKQLKWFLDYIDIACNPEEENALLKLDAVAAGRILTVLVQATDPTDVKLQDQLKSTWDKKISHWMEHDNGAIAVALVRANIVPQGMEIPNRYGPPRKLDDRLMMEIELLDHVKACNSLQLADLKAIDSDNSSSSSSKKQNAFRTSSSTWPPLPGIQHSSRCCSS